MDARPQVACLTYHEVTDQPSASGFQRPAARNYDHSLHTFARHLDRIAAGLHPPVLVSSLDLARPGRHVLLTFDDGGRSALDAADALARRGWQGHFFVITGRIGERTFLSAPQVRQLRDAGHLVGSHSHSHPDILRDRPAAFILDEWRRSAGILEDLLGEPCRAASVPGGDISEVVLATAVTAGFSWLFTSEPYLTPSRIGHCWILGRMVLKGETAPESIEELLRFQGWRRARLVRQLKELARRGLAPLYRAYVAYTTRSLPPATPGGP